MIDSQKKIIVEPLDSTEFAAKLALLKRPLVFTNGCFDILHRGHCTYLEQARNIGAALIVGINSDASVKRQNKGDDRPINTLQDRMAILASLQFVDAVVSFDEDTPYNLIKRIQPDHLVKGGDWKIDDIVGADIVSQADGQVHSIDFTYQRSTTDLLKRIRS